MWKMLDMMELSEAELFMFDCDDCSGTPLAPPPQFLIPPPPRPPALAEFTVVPQDCNEEQLAQQQWESDVCQAMPILDASLYSSQSLATSAMIAVFSLLLVLIVLISSLFVWKNKRKVQNLLPCKTPNRGPLNGAMPLGGGTLGSAHHHHHHGMYEDPDAHLGHHRPLVMHRHHHHQQLAHHHHYQQHHSELLQGKSIHYPSGYPMTRSPPFLVSSSPGPDPYRSNDNVYEELGPGRVDSDGESEPPLHSDDDFAEDELSLPGECSFQKETNLPAAAGATPYHERAAGSSSSGTAAAGGAGATGAAAASASLPQAVQERHSVLSSGSSTGQDTSTATASSASNNNHNHELASGSSNRRTARTRQSRSTQDQDLNNSTSTADIADLAPLYDNRSNLMSLGYVARSTAPQFYNTLEHEVERRNRINSQLSKAPVPPLSTIYRERIRYPHASQQYPSSVASGLMAATMRARTQPRVLDRRLAPHQHQHHRIHAAPMAQEPSYCYAEPMYNANYYYESAGGARPYASTLLPTAADYRHPYGDSSFGSDSGYSHHTPASSIGRQDYDVAEPQVLSQPKPSKLSSALNFSWNRNTRGKGTSGGAIAKTSGNSSNSSATSPNNNSSACSTVTSQLENNNTASLSPA
ncbi:lateral signaling target protein 2 homolog [Drosophila teissieri]|uniref:lateral signaling target protein 2 homolog n=1 Tax=Drosophila teissieri TaxID=7243 RepID=UPI001CB9EE80|nr:lateral signaling target protein 2 homolog [Drosophila teissieri]XP_043653348.1 lateral signaling target protein 2 homolog [Drosophila teissieri]